MEKERKGLFGRLLEFWTEKIRMVGEDKIGFWQETEFFEEHLAEMGVVAAVSQRETQDLFAEEMAEILPQTAEMVVLMEEKRKRIEETTENISTSKERRTTIFLAEHFQEERWEEAEESRLRRAFLWEIPKEEQEKRSIVPVAENVEQKEVSFFAEERVMQEGKEESSLAEEPILLKREEEKAENRLPNPVVDVEELMREMTRRLWEEREGCGRRLR